MAELTAASFTLKWFSAILGREASMPRKIELSHMITGDTLNVRLFVTVNYWLKEIEMRLTKDRV
jgi:hypothetical protein